MYKRIVLFFICLGFACGAFAQEIDTTQVEAPAEVPVISYSLAAKKYKIADIKITGIKNYDDFVLIGFSGLSVGDEITVPGGEAGLEERFPGDTERHGPCQDRDPEVLRWQRL